MWTALFLVNKRAFNLRLALVPGASEPCQLHALAQARTFLNSPKKSSVNRKPVVLVLTVNSDGSQYNNKNFAAFSFKFLEKTIIVPHRSRVRRFADKPAGAAALSRVEKCS